MFKGRRSQFERCLGKTRGRMSTRERHLGLKGQAEVLDCQGDKAGIHCPSGVCDKPCDIEATRKAVAEKPEYSASWYIKRA